MPSTRGLLKRTRTCYRRKLERFGFNTFMLLIAAVNLASGNCMEARWRLISGGGSDEGAVLLLWSEVLELIPGN
jgi:hypothetical protein